MAAIANLAVSVTARVGKFVKGMKRAGRRMKKFAGAVAASAKRVAKFGLALGAVAVGGLVLLTKRAFTSIDTMAKLSDAIGITTENLAALQLAGEITGVEIEGMNKALKDFVRRIGEAQTGTGEAIIALDALGISGKELADVGVFEAFIKTAEAINKLPNAAAKAETSYRLFGRQGVALVNTLAVGRKGLEAFRKEAIAMGLAVSREAARKIEMANDAIKRMTREATGLGRTIAIVTAPFVIVLAKDLQTLARQSKATGNAIVRGMRSAVSALGIMFDAVQQVSHVWHLFTAAAQMAFRNVIKNTQIFVTLYTTLVEEMGHAIINGIMKQLPAIGFALKVGFVRVFDNIKASLKEADPGIGGFMMAIEEEIEASLKSAAEAYKKFAVTPLSDTLLKWFDDAIERANELAREIEGAATVPRFVPALAGRGPQAGLRSLSQLGGTAGARAVSRAETNQAKELAELKKQTALLQAIKQKPAGGMKP